MVKYLSNASVIKCCHGGTVQLDGSATVKINGDDVLLKSGLVGKSIVGCPLAGPGITPCNKVVKIVSGEAKKFNSKDPPLLE